MTETQTAQSAKSADMRALETSLSRSEEFTGEAFKACTLARNLAESGELTVSRDIAELLERERFSGRALDAREAVHALRAGLAGWRRT